MQCNLDTYGAFCYNSHFLEPLRWKKGLNKGFLLLFPVCSITALRYDLVKMNPEITCPSPHYNL